MRSQFTRLARATAEMVGSAWAFVAACAVVLIWVVTGPLFDYSDTWQLVINTGTTIVTFLMVFLIQSTQNRDSKAIHLKLDELICSIEAARIELVDIEDARDEEIDRHQREFKYRCQQASEQRRVLAAEQARSA